MPWAAAASTSSVIRPRPSSRLNSEWAWRWVKSLGARVTGRYGKRPMDPISLPDDADLEALVADALDRLPSPFRDRLGSVAIVIEDEPTPDQLASVRAHGLFGLYQGVPRTAWGAEQASVPSKITIFRGPLTRAHRTPERLAAAVTDTVYHEIAHHFGRSEERRVGKENHSRSSRRECKCRKCQ